MNSMGPQVDILASRTATSRITDDGQTDRDPLGYNPPYHVCELCQHLKDNQKN